MLNRKQLLGTLGVTAIAVTGLTQAVPINKTETPITVKSKDTTEKTNTAAAKEKLGGFATTTLKGTTIYADKNSLVTINGKLRSAFNRKVMLLRKGSNNHYSQIALMTPNNKGEFSTKIKITGTTSYYLWVQGDGKVDGDVTYATTITTSKSNLKLYVNNVEKEIVPWVPNNINISIFDSNYISTTTTVETQQKIKNTWKTVTKSTTKNRALKIALPKGNKKSAHNTKLNYRLKVSGKGLNTKYHTLPTIRWVNATKGNAIERKAYSYIQKYCPNAALYVDNKVAKTAWGIALLSDAQVIKISPKVPNKHLRTVALHECGHQIQWKVHKTNWNKFVKKMDKVYGQKNGLGMEQNADCIANAWHKNSYFGYKGNCKGQKGTVAKNIIKGKPQW